LFRQKKGESKNHFRETIESEPMAREKGWVASCERTPQLSPDSEWGEGKISVDRTGLTAVYSPWGEGSRGSGMGNAESAAVAGKGEKVVTGRIRHPQSDQKENELAETTKKGIPLRPRSRSNAEEPLT